MWATQDIQLLKGAQGLWGSARLFDAAQNHGHRSSWFMNCAAIIISIITTIVGTAAADGPTTLHPARSGLRQGISPWGRGCMTQCMTNILTVTLSLPLLTLCLAN